MSSLQRPVPWWRRWGRDTSLREAQDRVPALSFVLIITQSLAAAFALGSRSILIAADGTVSPVVRLVGVALMAMIVAVVYAADTAMLRSIRRMTVLWRRHDWFMAGEHAVYILFTGIVEMLTLFRVITVFERDPLNFLTASGTQDTATITLLAILRVTLTFWTALQLNFTSATLAADMTTAKNALAAKLGGMALWIVDHVDPQRVSAATALTALAAAKAGASDAAFIASVQQLQVDEFAVQADQVRAEMRRELAAQLDGLEVRMATILAAIDSFVRAVNRGEPPPPAALAEVPVLAYWAPPSAPRRRAPHEADGAEPVGAASTLPLGALLYRGRLVANTRSAKPLLATTKWDTATKWLRETVGWTDKRLPAERANGYATYGAVLAMLEAHPERAASGVVVAALKEQAATFAGERAVAA